jgi:TonB family protein
VFWLISLLGAASAAPPPVALAGRAWTSAASDAQCYIETAVEGSPTTSRIRFGRGLTSPGYSIAMIGPLPEPKFQATTMVYKIGNSPAAQNPTFLGPETDGDNEYVSILPLEAGDAERLFEGEPITLALPRETMVRVVTTRLFGASKAMNDCRNERLREFGLTADMIDAIATFPKGQVAQLFSSDDYPQESLKRGESGRVAVLLTIGTDGRATDCRPMVRSMWPELNRATCNIIRYRGKFEPGRDRNGNAIVAPYVTAVRWLLP